MNKEGATKGEDIQLFLSRGKFRMSIDDFSCLSPRVKKKGQVTALKSNYHRPARSTTQHSQQRIEVGNLQRNFTANWGEGEGSHQNFQYTKSHDADGRIELKDICLEESSRRERGQPNRLSRGTESPRKSLLFKPRNASQTQKNKG